MSSCEINLMIGSYYYTPREKNPSREDEWSSVIEFFSDRRDFTESV